MFHEECFKVLLLNRNTLCSLFGWAVSVVPEEKNSEQQTFHS